MAGDFSPPKGTFDVLPPASRRWEALIAAFATRAARFGFELVITPVIDDPAIWKHGAGESSDVVRKEMYEFDDRGGRRLALRPEGTAPVVRAYLDAHPTTPWKAWYVAPNFRYERPQAGRYRQHHQLGAEAIGSDDPDLDVEVIDLLAGFYRAIGVTKWSLLVTSLGDAQCRPAYRELLTAYLERREDALCTEHREHWRLNPLRTLDCKKPECVAATSEAPMLLDHLCVDCANHFDRVKAGLEEVGIAYAVTPRLVRGLDYYTRTTFEFAGDALDGAQNAIGGGGRYDGLVEVLGGPPTPAIGFGTGIERILLAADAEGALPEPESATQVFVVDTAGGGHARRLVHELRERGIGAERAFDGRSMKSQFKAADRSGARLAVIVGPDEAAAGAVKIRPLRGEGEETSVDADVAVKQIEEHLKT